MSNYPILFKLHDIMKKAIFTALSMVFLGLAVLTITAVTQEKKPVFPGAHEQTPSLAQYFSWINNTNEGSTEQQTLINLEFFAWLKQEYGTQLDIYVISAGAIDKARWYGSMDSPEFKRQFPHGFDRIFAKAASMGTQLGTWGGPDGFGDTPAEEQARIDMMVKLCRDYKFRLLKFDAVVGQLRDEKQDAFVRMMNECRKYSPDLIFLNHRLNLSEEAAQHVTTSLWEGAETYIDVHMYNRGQTAPHHRAGALSRDLVPGLMRLTEDHGVCISSCLDYWEDDLILQAFNRTLLLSPQLYGNPWFLRDEEYPKLARIFNLARQYGKIMVEGLVLPKENYGDKAVSRGDDRTRLITLRNLSWDPFFATLSLDEEIGLGSGRSFEVRLLHPVERILGVFKQGDEVPVPVDPFRAALVLVTPPGQGGVGIRGCDFEVIRDIPQKPVEIALKGLPGTNHSISLQGVLDRFQRAELDGREVPGLIRGDSINVSFPGEELQEPYNRKLADLEPCPTPEDAEALYEATVFAADNNALEVRALQRSGDTAIPQVKAARDAFLEQELFRGRGVWDRTMFDGDPDTAFYLSRRRYRSEPINGGSLRLDFGDAVTLDELVITVGNEHALQPWTSEEAVFLDTSADLITWENRKILARPVMRIAFDAGKSVRYVRFRGTPMKILEIEGFLNGRALDRSLWRSSFLFSPFRQLRIEKSFQASFTLEQIPAGSYLAVALEGTHGLEGAYAAIRVDGKPVGAPDRSPSYPGNPWENTIDNAPSHYTYYVPIFPEMAGKRIDVVVLALNKQHTGFKPAVYITAYPAPYVTKKLILR